MNRPVYLNAASSMTAAGTHINDLLGILTSTHTITRAIDFAPERQGAFVTLPDLNALNLKKRDLRTMDPQALMGYSAAHLLQTQWQIQDAQQCGLYAGIPTISALVPGEEVLSQLKHYTPDRYDQAFIQHTQPMSGLYLLNSSLMSHISRLLGIQGEMGGFSHFSDAGAQAIAEAFWSIAEWRNQQAVVVGTSLPITPFSLQHLEALALPMPWIAGEGAASCVLSAQNTQGIRICAIERGFVAKHHNPLTQREQIMQRALRKAQVELDDISMLFSGDAFVHETPYVYTHWLERTFAESRIVDLNTRLGWLGAASPLLHLQLAAYLLSHSQRLAAVDNEVGLQREDCSRRTVVINCAGFHGQFCSMVIRKESYHD